MSTLTNGQRTRTDRKHLGRKEYVQELEERVRYCERRGVQATAEVQAAAKKIAAENAYLRQLLQKNGIWDPVLTKPGFVELLPIDTQHRERMNPAVAVPKMTGHLQTMSPQPSPVADPGLVGNYEGIMSTPPASVPDDTCGSQQTDFGTRAMENWSMAPDAPAIEATDFQLPLSSQQTYNDAGVATTVTNMPATSVASFDAAYGAPTYGDPTFAGMLATAYQSDSPATIWPTGTTGAHEATGIRAMNRLMPQGNGSSAPTTTAEAAAATMPLPPFISSVNQMFAAMHHHSRTDHDPPPLSISHVQ